MNRCPRSAMVGLCVAVLLWAAGAPAADLPLDELLKASLSASQGTPRILRQGVGPDDPVVVETSAAHQAFFSFADGSEIRLKENSRVLFSDSSRVRVEKGLVGFRRPSSAGVLAISLFPAEFRFPEGIVVCKAYPDFFRIAAIKGTLDLRLEDGQLRRYQAPEEISGCVREISQAYHPLEDLYFAWYWNAPGGGKPSGNQ